MYIIYGDTFAGSRFHKLTHVMPASIKRRHVWKNNIQMQNTRLSDVIYWPDGTKSITWQRTVLKINLSLQKDQQMAVIIGDNSQLILLINR